MAAASEESTGDELYNEEVEAIVFDIKKTYSDPGMSKSEKESTVSALLREMAEYTQPLIKQIEALTVPQKNLILCRIARIFPEIVQTEIKSVARYNDTTEEEATQTDNDTKSRGRTKSENMQQVLTRLGYQDLEQLYSHSKISHFFGEYINHDLERKESEKAKSNIVEKQLEDWKKQKAKKEEQILQRFKKSKTQNNHNAAAEKVGKNNAQKIIMMVGADNFEHEDDVAAICNASTKALRKLV